MGGQPLSLPSTHRGNASNRHGRPYRPTSIGGKYPRVAEPNNRTDEGHDPYNRSQGDRQPGRKSARMDRGERDSRATPKTPKIASQGNAWRRWAGSPLLLFRGSSTGAESNGRGEGMATNPLLPNDEREAWVKRNAALLRQVLTIPEVRTRILELLDYQPRADDEIR